MTGDGASRARALAVRPRWYNAGIMGVLTESGLDELLRAGCPACGPGGLTFRAYLDGRLPLLAGEPVGKLSWAYDGEKFVDGVFEVTCARCHGLVLRDEACPRCHRAGGLEIALASQNSYPLPTECPSCQGEEVRFVALVPAEVQHDGRRATAARTHHDSYDAGFHGMRVECRDCGVVAERTDDCPLCAEPGPLRPRPGS